MGERIESMVEAVEADAMPCMHEVHADPGTGADPGCLPERLKVPVAGKSPAQWAYERLILYIRNFEAQLDGAHEVAMGFTGAEAGVLRIEGMGYFDPDIVTFYGIDTTGVRTQLIQHVSQLNVLLRALPKPSDDAPATRIGFRLAADLDVAVAPNRRG